MLEVKTVLKVSDVDHQLASLLPEHVGRVVWAGRLPDNTVAPMYWSLCDIELQADAILLPSKMGVCKQRRVSNEQW